MTTKCLNFCGPYYNIEADLCGLPEGHNGRCSPVYQPDLPAFMDVGEMNPNTLEAQVANFNNREES